MEPEYFQYLLLMLVSIGKARPHNLCLISSFLDNQLVQEMLSQEDIGPGYSNKVCVEGGKWRSDLKRMGGGRERERERGRGKGRERKGE